MNRQFLMASAAAACIALSASGAVAQDYPNRTINLLVGFSAGGNVDILARQVQPFLEKHLGGASIAVINRPGAAGALMNQELANAAPDGYTIGMLSGPGFLTVLFGGQLQYDADSFDYIGTFTNEPYSLVVGNHTPYETLEQLVEAAKAAPDTITIGGAGLGSAPHLAVKVFERAADVSFNFIPGPGAAEMRNQVMGGHIDGGVTTVSVSVPMDNENQGRLLAVLAEERPDVAADFPTAQELGYDASWGALRGIGAPRGLPDDVREKLANAVRLTMEDPEFIALAERDSQMLFYRDGEGFRNISRQQYEVLKQIWDEQPWIGQ